MHYENNTDGLGHFSVVILNSDLVNSVIFYLLSRLRSILTFDLSTTFVRNLVVLMAISYAGKNIMQNSPLSLLVSKKRFILGIKNCCLKTKVST